MTWSLSRAFFKRDLLIDVSYKLSFMLAFVDILLTVAAFYFASRWFAPRQPDGYAAFPFMLTGIAVNGYMAAALLAFSQSIKGDNYGRTLKAALVSSVSAGSYVGYSSLYPFFRATIDAAMFLAGGLLCGLSLRGVNVASVIVVYVMSILAFGGLGILSAAFTLHFKRGDPVQWFVIVLSWTVGGVFYPRDVLPGMLQRLGALLPIVPATDAMRAAMLHGASVTEIGRSLQALALFSAVIVPLGVFAFLYAIRQAKVNGSLDHR